MLHPLHQELLDEFAHVPTKPVHAAFNPDKYFGTTHPSRLVGVADTRALIKAFIRRHPLLAFTGFRTLLTSLYFAPSSNEHQFASLLIEYLPKLRRQLEPNELSPWLERLEGWAEIDGLCQSNFTAKEVLTNWSAWESMLDTWSRSHHISQRRASLVLLVKPIRESNDRRILKRALENIDRLKSEKDILLTKAISWLLREMIVHHREVLTGYLDVNADSLPKIALRETRKKLVTGKK